MYSRTQIGILTVLSLSLFIILILSATIEPYGFFIDEVYFIACSKRLAFGYVDQPPLSLLLLAPVVKLFGHNMLAIRVLPALSMAATVFITGLVAKKLGGGIASMLLAGLAVMVMPIFLIFGSFYSMNAYEPLILVSVVYFMIKMIREDDPGYWLHIGVLSGIGLMMKHTFVLYGAALVIGMLISEKRRLLLNRWLLWGGLACFLITLPNLIWQYIHDFPSLELYKNSFSSKNIEKPYLQVVHEQVIFVNPATFLLWFTGLIALMLTKGKPYRFMLFAYLFLLVVMVSSRSSRPDRIASIYTFFVAAGAVGIEQYLRSSWKRIAQVSVAILMLTAGIILAPAFMPLLPPAELKPYLSRLGLKFDIEEGKIGEPIPQWLADRIGWRDLAAEVGKVYHSLPADERQNCIIVCDDYGPGGAMEIYSEEFDLPLVFATHNSFHSWGPPSDSIKTYIGVSIDAEGTRPLFETMDLAGVSLCPDCTRPQREIEIYVMRGPKISIEKEWEGFKEYH
jgi:4-amino-4-deoxy-L-arabinose transferase-like glycosyltransferase